MLQQSAARSCPIILFSLLVQSVFNKNQVFTPCLFIMQRYHRVTECKVQKKALNHILITLRSSALLLSGAMQKVLALSMNGSFHWIPLPQTLYIVQFFLYFCSTGATLLRSKLRRVGSCCNQNVQNNKIYICIGIVYTNKHSNKVDNNSDTNRMKTFNDAPPSIYAYLNNEQKIISLNQLKTDYPFAQLQVRSLENHVFAYVISTHNSVWDETMQIKYFRN